MSSQTHVTQTSAAVPKLESEFTIVAIVRDRHAGERTFTADELRSTLTECMSDLHLEVQGIRVMTPQYENSRVGTQPSAASCGEECTCPSISGGDHAGGK